MNRGGGSLHCMVLGKAGRGLKSLHGFGAKLAKHAMKGKGWLPSLRDFVATQPVSPNIRPILSIPCDPQTPELQLGEGQGRGCQWRCQGRRSLSLVRGSEEAKPACGLVYVLRCELGPSSRYPPEGSQAVLVSERLSFRLQRPCVPFRHPLLIPTPNTQRPQTTAVVRKLFNFTTVTRRQPSSLKRSAKAAPGRTMARAGRRRQPQGQNTCNPACNKSADWKTRGLHIRIKLQKNATDSRPVFCARWPMTTMLRPSLAGDKGLEMRSVAELLRLPWLEPWMTQIWDSRNYVGLPFSRGVKPRIGFRLWSFGCWLALRV